MPCFRQTSTPQSIICYSIGQEKEMSLAWKPQLDSLERVNFQFSPDISWIAKVITPGWCVLSVLATGIP